MTQPRAIGLESEVFTPGVHTNHEFLLGGFDKPSCFTRDFIDDQTDDLFTAIDRGRTRFEPRQIKEIVEDPE